MFTHPHATLNMGSGGLTVALWRPGLAMLHLCWKVKTRHVTPVWVLLEYYSALFCGFYMLYHIGISVHQSSSWLLNNIKGACRPLTGVSF